MQIVTIKRYVLFTTSQLLFVLTRNKENILIESNKFINHKK